MAVMQMQKLTICALKKDRKGVLELLQKMGTVEIIPMTEETEGFSNMDTASQRMQFDKSCEVSKQAIEVLDRHVPEKTSMFASLEGKRLVGQKKFDEVGRHAGSLMAEAREILAAQKRIQDNQAEIIKKEAFIESMQPWLALDVPMNLAGTKSTVLLLGTLGPDLDRGQILEMMADEELQYDVRVVSSDRNQTCVAVICLKADAAQVEERLRINGFARLSDVSRRTPAQRVEKRNAEITTLQEENARLKEEICSKAGLRGDLKVVSDYFRMRSDKYEVLGDLQQSGKTFLICGYILAKDVEETKKRLTERYDLLVEASEIPEEEEAPVQLSNNRFSGAFESIVGSYGLPHKGELDPTFFMSLFYVFLFGLMLSDAAYGLIIFVACAIVLWKFPRMDVGMRKSLTMFKWCGLSTVFWGLMFGGFFGDVLKVVANVFMGVENEALLDVLGGGWALWFVPLNAPMTMLLWSLLFGIIHLFFGLGMKGYSLIKKGDWKGALFDVGFWYCFLLGLMGLLIPSSLFQSIAGWEGVSFPAWLQTASLILTAIGGVGLLLFAGRDRKSPVLRVALGAYELYGVTSWLSDVLSYSRLLALGLATGVIAQVVNSMGSMAGSSVFGLILFIIVFIVGHTLNLAINLLGAYVHTNRLQYVEYFGKFYEGGGRAFAPFHENTNFIEIQED